MVLALLSMVALASLAILVSHEPSPPPVSSAPLYFQDGLWRVGQEVELVLRTQPVRAGEVVSVTVMAPGPGEPQMAGVDPEFFGLSGVQISWLPSEYRETDVALASALGARYVGLDFAWQRLEPEPGQYAWEESDAMVSLAKQYGLRLAPMLLYTPRWASTAPFAPLNYHHAPPADYADYRDFVYAVVDRYKPYGRSPLTADGYGIADWVIWNEPNVRTQGDLPEPGSFWTGSMEDYLILLRAGYEGAHAADPGCNVLNGGLADLFWTEPDPASYLVTALSRFYDPNGDGDPEEGARPFFDTLNIHSYQLDAPDPAWYQERLEAAIEIMARFGDAEKPIWITETGYGSVPAPPAASPLVDEDTQASGVVTAYQTLAAYPQVERVFWWSLRDYYHNPSATDPEMEGHYGLLRAGYTPKPAFAAYGRLTGQLGQVLTLTAVTDARGIARVAVPASVVSRPGRYLLFATVDGVQPAAVVMYDAVAATGD
jgi:polysaccharide biosynthesis protein PslG